jgi:hypothetical protein
LHPIFRDTCEIYIDFYNGDAILPYETDKSQILGLRLFVHGATTLSLSKFLEQLGNEIRGNLLKQEVFSVENVLSVLGEHYHSLLGKSNPIPLVLILDNYQYTMKQFSKIEGEWKDIAKNLGGYMCTSTGINENLSRDQLVLIPVIAGTVPKEDVKFELTGYSNTIFPLPPFTFENIIELLKDEKIVESMYDTAEKRRFWYLMGMIPRSLEYSVQIVQKERDDHISESQEEDRMESLFEKVLNFLKEKYGELDIVNPKDSETSPEKKKGKVRKRELLYYCLTGTPISTSIEWINKMILEGKTHMDGNKRILLPYPYFVSLIQFENSKIPQNLFPTLQSQFNWILFEELVMRVIHFQLEYQKDQEVDVLELFPGAHFTEDVGFTITPHTMCNFKKNKTPFLTGTRETFQIQGNVSVNSETIVSLCVERNLLVDGTILATTTQQKSLLILIQFKYKKKPSIDREDQIKTEDTPLNWYKSLSKIETMKKCKGITVIYVYITNANIPKKAKEALAECERLIIIEQSIAKEFFAPNLLPYFATIEEEEGQEEEMIEDVDISEEISEEIQEAEEEKIIEKDKSKKVEVKRRGSPKESGKKKHKQ